MNFLFLFVLAALAYNTRADPTPQQPHPVCSFRPPVCTREDIVRGHLWRGYIRTEPFSNEIINLFKAAKCNSVDDFLKVLVKTPGRYYCIDDEIVQYDKNDCSTLNQIRKCIIESIQGNDWTVPRSKEFDQLLKTVTEKDKVVPSDAILKKMKRFVGEKWFPKCYYENFLKIRYCENPCQPCTV